MFNNFKNLVSEFMSLELDLLTNKNCDEMSTIMIKITNVKAQLIKVTSAILADKKRRDFIKLKLLEPNIQKIFLKYQEIFKIFFEQEDIFYEIFFNNDHFLYLPDVTTHPIIARHSRSNLLN